MAKQWLGYAAAGLVAVSLVSLGSRSVRAQAPTAPSQAPTAAPATEAKPEKVPGKAKSDGATPSACTSCFTVRVLADATVTSDSVRAADGKSSASASFGIAASKRLGDGELSLEAAFAGGSVGSKVAEASPGDYFAFLRSPKSALGGELRGAFQWKLAPWLYLGPQLGLRAGAATFELDDGSMSQHVAVMGFDVTCATALLLDDSQGIELHLDAGISSRFWNKPQQGFVDRLGLKTDAHAFFGPRAAVYFTVKNAVIGIELSRYWGGNLERFKEFTILPYAGVSLGGTVAGERAPGTAHDSRSEPASGITEPEPPQSTRTMSR